MHDALCIDPLLLRQHALDRRHRKTCLLLSRRRLRTTASSQQPAPALPVFKAKESDECAADIAC